jgi:hypothetical protein
MPDGRGAANKGKPALLPSVSRLFRWDGPGSKGVVTPDADAALDGLGDDVLGPDDGGLESVASGEPGGDRRGVRATGAVR